MGVPRTMASAAITTFSRRSANVSMSISDAEAMPYIYRASALAPDEGFSNMYIGYEEQQKGHLAEAISRYDHALRDFNLTLEQQALVYKNMAVAYRDMGNVAKANECYAKARSLKGKPPNQ